MGPLANCNNLNQPILHSDNFTISLLTLADRKRTTVPQCLHDEAPKCMHSSLKRQRSWICLNRQLFLFIPISLPLSPTHTQWQG